MNIKADSILLFLELPDKADAFREINVLLISQQCNSKEPAVVITHFV